MSAEPSPIWGPAVTPEAAAILDVGLGELPTDELTQLANDLYLAQTMLIGAAFKAVFESGRVTAICPPTPDELLNPTHLAFRIAKEPDE